MQGIAEACLAGRPIEDARVELKAEWPADAVKTARQIAGHANASRGQRILWIIGLDEGRRRAQALEHMELADWWSKVRRYFDGVAPELRNIVVPVPGGEVTALEFDGSRGPYVVATEGGGRVSREVPWRESNGTRSAFRHEVMQSLVAAAEVPELELVRGEISIVERHPDRYSGETDDRHYLRGSFTVYVSALEPAMLPQHRQRWTIGSERLGRLPASPVVSPPYRYINKWDSVGQRVREPVGHIEVLDRSGMFVHRSGEITVTIESSITQAQSRELSLSPHLSLEMVLPVDRTGVDSRLVVEFSHLANSAAPQEPPDDGLAYDRTIAVFTPVDPPDAD